MMKHRTTTDNELIISYEDLVEALRKAYDADTPPGSHRIPGFPIPKREEIQVTSMIEGSYIIIHWRETEEGSI